MGQELMFWYKNHRDEVAERRVVPVSVRLGNTGWYSAQDYPEGVWLMLAWDLKQNAFREFALDRIVSAPAPVVAARPGQTQIGAVLQLLQEGPGKSADVGSHLRRYQELLDLAVQTIRNLARSGAQS